MPRFPQEPTFGAAIQRTIYETTDGKHFSMVEAAEHHQDRINQAAQATAELRNGASLLHALTAAGMSFASGLDELSEITKDTELVISHWQCRDNPGYKPQWVNHDGRVFCFGYAGSWSGPYGGLVKLVDLVSYYAAAEKWRERHDELWRKVHRALTD